jgi:hypothetical protein
MYITSHMAIVCFDRTFCKCKTALEDIKDERCFLNDQSGVRSKVSLHRRMSWLYQAYLNIQTIPIWVTGRKS